MIRPFLSLACMVRKLPRIDVMTKRSATLVIRTSEFAVREIKHNGGLTYQDMSGR